MAYGYLRPLGGFALEFWFRHTAIPTYPEAFVSQQSQNKAVAWSTDPAINGRQLIIYLDSTIGALKMEIRNTAGTLVGSFADTAGDYSTDDAWHFVAMRLEGDKKTVTLWLDNEVKYTAVLAVVLDWVPGVMSVGGAYAPHLGNYGTYLYNGGLAYFAAWDVVRSAARLSEHYTAGSGGTVFYGDDEVTRLQRLYSFAGVPVNAQRFDEPVTTLQGLQVAGQNGLEKILATGSDASGLVFADGQSSMVYQNRRHRYNRPVLVTLTEETSSAPDVGMGFTTDDTKVYNDVRASRPYGGSARIRNRASEYEYGQKIYPLSLAITSDDEMRNAGSWVAERYGEDKVRIEGVTLSAESSDLIQYLAETVSIGDRIAFDDLPDNAPDTYMEYVVEAISVEANFKAETWSLGLQLSPAELWDVLQVGVSTLGDGSRIAF
jgi:hypothetical protein